MPSLPNPFNHLCLPYWLVSCLWFSSTVITGLILKQLWKQLLKKHELSEDEDFEGRLSYPDFDPNFVRIEAESLAKVIDETRPDLVEGLSLIIVDYLDCEIKARERHHLCLLEKSKLARKDIAQFEWYLVMPNLISFIVWFISQIAMIIQLHLYRTNDETGKSLDGWNVYQAWVVCQMYSLRTPITFYILNSHSMLEWFEWDMTRLSTKKTKIDAMFPLVTGPIEPSKWIYIIFLTRLFLPSLMISPLIITHFISGFFVFFPMTAFMILTYAICIGFYQSRFPDTFRLISESFKKHFWLGCIVMLIIEAPMTLGSIPFIRYTRTGRWTYSLLTTLKYGYCEEVIKFDISKLNWREWSVLLSWII